MFESQNNFTGYNSENVSAEPMTPAYVCGTYDFFMVVRRWGALIIDLLLLLFILLILYRLSGDKFFPVFFTIYAIIVVLYFPLTEGLAGRSLGKLITRIIIVDEKGEIPGLKKGFLRSIPRLIEINPFLFGAIPALILILVTKKKQRLGDKWAKTYVLKNKDLWKISYKPRVDQTMLG